MLKIIIVAILISVIAIGSRIDFAIFPAASPSVTPDNSSAPSPTPTITLSIPQQRKALNNDYHIFQTFNNCGPAALSMALSYYGINETQRKLGQDLRPYQNLIGDNDDKSVTLSELGEKAREVNLIPYHRPLGNIEIIRLFIAYDIPIIARTLTKESEDIGHYRVIKGYDDTTSEIIQDDSLQGKNLKYSFKTFNALWAKFNFEYLVLVPEEKKEIADAILGENKDTKTAWENATINAKKQLDLDPNDIYARLNHSVALYNTGQYQKSVEEFEKAESKLSFRTLWYQIEPILAYYKLGNFKKVFSMTDEILNNGNRAFSELYIMRGNIFQKQGNPDLAEQEYEKAVLYNNNMQAAKNALASAE